MIEKENIFFSKNVHSYRVCRFKFLSDLAKSGLGSGAWVDTITRTNAKHMTITKNKSLFSVQCIIAKTM